jgi:hypothetical protein
VAQWQPDYPLFRQSRIFTQTDLPHWSKKLPRFSYPSIL